MKAPPVDKEGRIGVPGSDRSTRKNELYLLTVVEPLALVHGREVPARDTGVRRLVRAVPGRERTGVLGGVREVHGREGNGVAAAGVVLLC